MTDKCWNIIKTDMTIEKNLDGTMTYMLKPHMDISKDELLTVIQQVYDSQVSEEFKDTVYLRLKGLSSELLAEVFKYAFTRYDLKDPLTSLNIFNLIKIYNTLDESFFEDENVWFSSLENMLDVKLLIHNELKQFIRQFSIYFLSLIKSYNKITYTSVDNNIEMGQLFKTLFLTMDFMTAAGIFSTTKDINTNELLLITDAFKYLNDMMVKNCMGINLLNSFLEEKEITN